MPKRYLGNIITNTPTAPAGPYQDSAASGVWSLAEALTYRKADQWPTQGNIAPEYGLFIGGNTNAIDYVNIVSAGNASDFGDLIASDRFLGSFASTTRAVISGGDNTNRIQYVTIATTGNATDFGDMSYTPDNTAEMGCSNSTRGLTGGGFNGGYQNNIDYVTIATTGNGADFGDLTNPRKRSQQVPSPTRAVIIGGGIAPSEGNVTSMEKVEILTTGASVDFGTLANGVQSAGYFSNGHGGL